MNKNKSEKAFRTITEAADILELPAHVLRFWESKFKYIKPMKRGGGRRYYRPEDIHLLIGIKYLLYSEGLTIKGAQKVIQAQGVKATAKLGATQILKPNHESQQAANSKATNEKETTIKSFNGKNIKIVHGANLDKIKTVLENLIQIRNRVENRWKKTSVT